MLSDTDSEVLIRNSIFGLSLYGVVTAVPGANQFTIPNLSGMGVNKFVGVTNPYVAFVLRKGTGTGLAPQGEQQPITAYVNATGSFTTSAFTVAVAAGDEILILSPNLAVVPAAPDGLGTVFSIVKSVTQSNIVAAGIDLTLASSGLLELIAAYVENGATAFDSAAHGATAALYTNNVSGNVSFMTAAQALLTANCIVSGRNATSWIGVVLESGKKVSIKATGENFTSAGVANIYLIFRRLAAGANVAAA